MATANLIYKGLKANLPAERNATSFYLTTDTKELYFGENLYTEAVRFYTGNKPANPAQGVIYVDESDGTGYSWDGSTWKTVIESAQGIKNELIGDASNDTHASNTIEGAKRYADKKANDLIGTDADVAGADTIKGANKAAANAQAEAEAKVASVSATANKGISVDNTDNKNLTIGIHLSAKTGNQLGFANAEGEDGGLFFKAPDADTYEIAKDAESGDYAAVYRLKKNGNTDCGVAINIPKDMVVESGSVVTNPDGKPAGTYLKLVLANASNDEIFINVSSLIEYVTTGSRSGDMVVIDIDNDHKVTATITDGTITEAKLHADLQTKLADIHTHTNKSVLDGITSQKVENWDAAFEAVTVGSF